MYDNIWEGYKTLSIWARLIVSCLIGTLVFEAVGSAAKIESDPHQKMLGITMIQYTPPSVGDCSIVGSNSGSFSPNCHNNYSYAPQQRHINSELQGKILAKIPKSKPVTVSCALGSDEGCTLAQELYDFFKQSGYTMTETGPGQAIYSKPLEGLGYDPNTGEFRIGSQ